MRKIFLLLSIALFYIPSSNAQTDYRNALMGTWIWYNNTDTFRVKFKKGIINIDADIPCLYGYHEYKSGNKILESSLKNYDADIAMKLYTIETWVPKIDREANIIDTLVGSIADVEYRDNMYMKRDLTFTVSPDKKTMQFEAQDRERTMLTTGTETPNELLPKDRTTFFFPKEATFIKEENMPVVVLPPPTISTGNYTNLGFYSATLNGSINPNGNKNVAVYFDYGANTAYGKRVDATPALVSGTTLVNVSYNLTGLTANNTTYHYRLVTIANGNIYYGEDKSFGTLYDVPTINGLWTKNLGSAQMTLEGAINAHGLGTVQAYFEYGTNEQNLTRVNATPHLITGENNISISTGYPTIYSVTGDPIYYRIVIILGNKTYYSSTLNFTLPLPPKYQ